MKTKQNTFNALLTATMVIFGLLEGTALANADFGVGASSCTVDSGSDQGERSLRDLLEKSNAGQLCRFNITFKGGARIVSQQPYDVLAQGLLVTGEDLTSANDPLPPLGVVLDARSLGDQCVFRVAHPQQTVLKALTVYVAQNRWNAVCDPSGQSVLDPQSPAHNAHYSHIRVCRGDGSDDCNWTPAITVPPAIDGDGDGLTDDTDRCDNGDIATRKIMLRNGCLQGAFAASDPARPPFFNRIPDRPLQFMPHRAVAPDPIQCNQGLNYSSADPAGNACDADWDNDGQENWEDACSLDPDNGCLPHDNPDADEDGMPDTYDLCPSAAGVPHHLGCPNSYCIRQTNEGIRSAAKRGIDQDEDGIDVACDQTDLPKKISADRPKTDLPANSDSNSENVLPARAGGCSLIIRK